MCTWGGRTWQEEEWQTTAASKQASKQANKQANKQTSKQAK
jgi:hypothetical protein